MQLPTSSSSGTQTAIAQETVAEPTAPNRSPMTLQVIGEMLQPWFIREPRTDSPAFWSEAANAPSSLLVIASPPAVESTPEWVADVSAQPYRRTIFPG